MKLDNLSKKFGEVAKENNLVVVTAESCTAGLIAATIAMTPGSSAWLDSGFIVYTPEAKNKLLGVSFETIDKYNITSEEVALEMAFGAINKSNVNIAVAVTGVAGPSGGTDNIPVGTISIAWVYEQKKSLKRYSQTVLLKGDRNEIREQVVEIVLEKIIKDFS